MVRKLGFKSLLIFILLTSIASATDMGQLQSNTIFNFSGIGVNITVLALQNFSQIQYPASPTNTLEFTINGSTIQFNATTDKTLYNITRNNDVVNWSYTGSGFINVNATVFYKGANYQLFRNGTSLYASNKSSAAGAIYYNLSQGGNFSIQRISGVPALISPVNQSTQTITTLPYTQTFSWSDEGSNQYNIQVAKDTGFSIIVSDLNVLSNQTSIGMWDTAQYFWRVRTFDGISTYGNWSDPFNFELTQSSLPSSDGSTGVQGIVYEVKASGNVVVPNARVTLWNNTATFETTTDTSGYYLFKTQIANISTYSLKATKLNYEDSNTALITTVNGTWVIKNIYMQACVSGFNCFYNQQYVKFTVRSSTGIEYNDVTISITKYGETSTVAEDTTDDDGIADFLLEKPQKYTATITKASIGLSMTYNFYGIDPEHIIYHEADVTDRASNISYTLNWTENNATTIYLNITYTDSEADTTALDFFVRNETGTVLYTTTTTGAISSYVNGYAVNNTAGLIYFWGFNATHSAFGTFNETNVMEVRGRLIDLKLDDEDWYTWISVGLIVFIGALFSFTTNKYGYVIVPLFSGFLWAIDWLEVRWGLILVTIILGILAFLNAKEKQEGYA